MAITKHTGRIHELLSGAAAKLAGQTHPGKILGVAIVAMFALISTYRVSEGQQPKKSPAALLPHIRSPCVAVETI
jgi:hypothetical protein